MDYVIQANDTPSKLAQKWAGNAGKWPEFCKANPKFPKHATYGCVFYPGNKAVLPDDWPGVIAASQPVVPPPGPNSPPPPPGPVGPSSPLAPAPAPAAAGMFGVDTKTLLIGAGVIGVGVVIVYALKKKSQAA